MRADVYRYELTDDIDFEHAEAALDMALTATECLHGSADVRLDASYAADPARRSIVVDATTDVGRCICRVFTGYLAREFGEDSFHVRRVPDAEGAQPEGSAV